jgi:hypothetical protein
VIEGQLHTVRDTCVVHTPCLTPRRRHRFFAVDRFHAGFGRCDHHVRMQVGPGADADHVEVLFGQHLVVIGVDRITTMAFPERLGVLRHEISKCHDLRMGRCGVAGGMKVRHAKTTRAVRSPRFATPDNPNPQLCLCHAASHSCLMNAAV